MSTCNYRSRSARKGFQSDPGAWSKRRRRRKSKRRKRRGERRAQGDWDLGVGLSTREEGRERERAERSGVRGGAPDSSR